MSKREERLKAKKAKAFRRNLTILAIAILAVAFIAGFYLLSNRGSVGLKYGYVSAGPVYINSTAGFSAVWSDSAGLSGYVFGSNLTGTFMNDSWAHFTTSINSTSAYSSVSKIIDSNYGDTVEWRFWANNSKNEWNVLDLQRTTVSANKVLLRTSMGNIEIELFEDMPITAGNFRNLTNLGIYDQTIFHRVVKDFVVQGGDPTGTGYGDPSIATIPDELPNRHSNIRGTVAMAKSSEPNSASSQFYINLKDNSQNLDSGYSVFGRVIEGMDVVDAIGQVETDQNDRPTQNVTLISAEFVS